MTIEQERDIAVKALQEIAWFRTEIGTRSCARAALAAITAKATEAAMMDMVAYGTGVTRSGKHIKLDDMFDYSRPSNRLEIEIAALSLIRAAEAKGQVLTIHLKPRLPLAMGNYVMTYEVRPVLVRP